MEMDNYTENEFVIDLSETKNTAQLAAELSSIIDKSDITGKSVCLKLGNLDLKQSQLLSIKALIESIDATIQSVATNSEMTEASAVSLGIILRSTTEIELPKFHDSISEQIGHLNDTFSTAPLTSETNTPTEEVEASIVTEIENSSNELSEENSKILNDVEVQKALDTVLGITPIKTEEEKIDTTGDEVKTNIELIEPKQFKEHFEATETKERSFEEKYVLLDTEGITPEDISENTDNTAELSTLYLTQTLRSGQTVTYEGNIFIIGDAHPGSEVIATGDVTVWGILGGIVHAGSEGNQTAKVRALKLNPIQLRIAGLYSRRNDTVNVPFVQKTDEFTPEEARINNKQIVVYKTLRRED